ncbi:metal ABC transporter ATP-binding protein [Candidatus Methylacidiphilum infernorum]|uniref:ABC-type Mn2+/Zn2+ transport system, ATPase component n=1 Tax=Methylacidiphilum infernorum (isolate V4) TaxID=481448 RepID=B3DWL7_METI4|nr:metal ABC transporter ATP-binding protein [Candidatus Methylacidiphilum infernorum]ACD83680.1 ABC-type Mn2+/Zn2+ transport system, ATPase component [Methylacidiphilum infernorum V4]
MEIKTIKPIPLLQRDQKLLLKAENLSVSYNEESALEGISMEIEQGKIIALIGPNGAGKTTLLKCFAGIIKPNKGEIWRREGLIIGYLPQRPSIPRYLPVTVEEFVALRLGYFRFFDGLLGKRKSEEKVVEILKSFHAEGLRQRRLNELSGGELQKVMVASTLAKNPALLLLDEPLSGIDAVGGIEFDQLLHELKEKKAIGTILVSHDLQLVSHIADWVYFLNHRILTQGRPADVLQEKKLAAVYSLIHTQGKKG